MVVQLVAHSKANVETLGPDYCVQEERRGVWMTDSYLLPKQLYTHAKPAKPGGVLEVTDTRPDLYEVLIIDGKRWSGSSKLQQQQQRHLRTNMLHRHYTRVPAPDAYHTQHS